MFLSIRSLFFRFDIVFFGCEMKREGKSEKERKNTSPKETVEKKKTNEISRRYAVARGIPGILSRIFEVCRFCCGGHRGCIRHYRFFFRFFFVFFRFFFVFFSFFLVQPVGTPAGVAGGCCGCSAAEFRDSPMANGPIRWPDCYWYVFLRYLRLTPEKKQNKSNPTRSHARSTMQRTKNFWRLLFQPFQIKRNKKKQNKTGAVGWK